MQPTRCEGATLPPMHRVRQFVQAGIAGLLPALVELVLTAGSMIAMLVEARRRWRAHRPVHLADRMDRAYYRRRNSSR